MSDLEKIEVSNDRLDEAERLARGILDTQPDNADALNGLGLIYLQQAKWSAAVEMFRSALAGDDARSDFKENLVRSLDLVAKDHADRRNFGAAKENLEQALSLDPDNLLALCHLSEVLCRAGHADDALAVAENGVGMDIASPLAHDMRGLALQALDRPDEAITSFQDAIALDPAYGPAHNNLGNIFAARGEFIKSIEQFEAAIKLNPEDARIINNLGLVLAGHLNMAEAEATLRRALSIDPNYAEAHFNLSRVLLMQGKYEDGWRENEWRWKCPDFPSTWRDFPYPMWQGESLAGKTILIWSEQGIGDEIMFANPIPDLIGDGATIVMECSERLVPVFERSFSRLKAVPRQDPPDPAIERAGIDFQIPLASLCTYFRTDRLSFLSERTSYLRADPTMAAGLKKRYRKLGDGLKVGICWRSGNPIAGADRSAELELWDGVLSAPGRHFINLQYGEVDAEIAAVKDRLGVDIHQDKSVDPLASAEDWFAQVAALDLVISVDNSTIQVSGSQGIPTWTLLSHSPEWRFGLAGEGHDWHPSLRIFRQPSPGDWQSVFARVRVELTHFPFP